MHERAHAELARLREASPHRFGWAVYQHLFEVAVQQEGTVLDVKVIKWERERVVEVLSNLTGNDFGTDPQPWEDWWRKNRNSFELR